VANPSTPRLLALHGLRLKGIAEADDIAAYMLTEPEPVRSALEQCQTDGFVSYRHGRIGGYAHTAAGRSEAERLVAEEVESRGVGDRIRAAYEGFLGVNEQLLAVCTSWQLRTVDGETQANRHDDADHDRAVLEELRCIGSRVSPILCELGDALDRFRGHGHRLRYALERLLAGDHDYFTKPMFPSYHSVWFELHEDLLATLGTARASEGGT
jgi:hypothetical protein